MNRQDRRMLAARVSMVLFLGWLSVLGGAAADASDWTVHYDGNTEAITNSGQLSGNGIISGYMPSDYTKGDHGEFTLSNNQASVSDITITGSVSGVYVAPSFMPEASGEVMGKITAKGNSLTVSGSTAAIITAVYDATDNSNGQDSSSLTSENNTLHITDSHVSDIINTYMTSPYGNSENIFADNKTIVEGTHSTGSLLGTYQRYGTSGSISLTGNNITVKDSTIDGMAMGSNIYDSKKAVAEGNSMSLSGSTVNSYLVGNTIYGGEVSSENNSLTLTDGTHVLGPVMGEFLVATSSDSKLSASGNKVSLDGSYAGTVITAELGGLGEPDKAENNSLSISGSSSVLLAAGTISSGLANGNTVSVKDSTAGIVVGGSAGAGNADNNVVTLSGNTTLSYSQALQNLSSEGIVNTEAAAQQFFSGVTGESAVIGGYTETGSASGNVINVTDSADLSDAHIYGALSKDGTRPSGSGNTLNIGYDGENAKLWNNNEVKAVSNVDTIALYRGTWGKTMLHVKDAMDLTNTTVDISHLSFDNTGNFGPDSYTTLIDDDVTDYNDSGSGKNVTIEDGNYGNGVSFDYSLGDSSASLTGHYYGKGTTADGNIVLKTGDVNVDKVTFHELTWGNTPLTLSDKVTYDFGNSSIDTSDISFADLSMLKDGENEMTLLDTNGRAKNLSEQNLSGETKTYTISRYTVGTTLEGEGRASLMDGNVIYSLNVKNARAQNQTHKTVMGKAAVLSSVMDGSDLVIRTLGTVRDNGEHVWGFSSLMGGENHLDTGSYIKTNMYNGHAGVGWTDRKPDGREALGAVFYDYGNGRYRTSDLGETGHGRIHYEGGGLFGRVEGKDGIFAEGSFRTGRVKNDADRILHDASGNWYDYDTHSRYTALHGGIGKMFTMNTHDTLETYARYFYTHINDSDFEAKGHYHLDDSDSEILRLGARFTRTVNDFSWYGGLAFEHEFDGKIRGTADGVAIRSADIGGNSLRMEAGLRDTRGPWTWDLGMHAYTFERRGVGGNLDISYRF